MQSQIPSQAKIRNFASALFILLISGEAVIICLFGGRFLSCLYSQSPKDHERFKIPLTLFSSTNPPASSIRFFSSGLSGLWSKESSLAVPFLRQATHQESPALATKISVGVTKAVMAVHPTPIAIKSG